MQHQHFQRIVYCHHSACLSEDVEKDHKQALSIRTGLTSLATTTAPFYPVKSKLK